MSDLPIVYSPIELVHYHPGRKATPRISRPIAKWDKGDLPFGGLERFGLFYSSCKSCGKVQLWIDEEFSYNGWPRRWQSKTRCGDCTVKPGRQK